MGHKFNIALAWSCYYLQSCIDPGPFNWIKTCYRNSTLNCGTIHHHNKIIKIKYSINLISLISIKLSHNSIILVVKLLATFGFTQNENDLHCCSQFRSFIQILLSDYTSWLQKAISDFCDSSKVEQLLCSNSTQILLIQTWSTLFNLSMLIAHALGRFSLLCMKPKQASPLLIHLYPMCFGSFDWTRPVTVIIEFVDSICRDSTDM